MSLLAIIYVQTQRLFLNGYLFLFPFSQGKQLEDYYKKQKKVIDFQVKGPPGETWKGLLAALHLQHINAVSSSQKLTA